MCAAYEPSQKRGFFSFIFDCSEDHEAVLTVGPWYYGDVGLVLLPWSENPDSSYAFREIQLLWVSLESLPPHLCCSKVLRVIGDSLREFQRASRETLNREGVPHI
jgi:hypothetical protein